MKASRIILLLALLINTSFVFSHREEDFTILEIEEGRPNFQNKIYEAEYNAALKRKQRRILEAMPLQKKVGLFVKAGVEHIVPKGLDHILFVLGLFFSSLMLRPLVKQITAFTLAHTMTLAMAALQLVDIPSALIEPLIALSIVWVAVENCIFNKVQKWRPMLVFSFGLLHGLGFASVLNEFGLPKTNFVTSLLAFNIGVELGQLLVLIMALALVWYIRHKRWYRSYVQIPVSVSIALIGLFWCIERVCFYF